MAKYFVDATLTICLSDVSVTTEIEGHGKDDIEDYLSDLIAQVASKRLSLLDLRGGRSGEGGIIEHFQVDSIDNWSAE